MQELMIWQDSETENTTWQSLHTADLRLFFTLTSYSLNLSYFFISWSWFLVQMQTETTLWVQFPVDSSWNQVPGTVHCKNGQKCNCVSSPYYPCNSCTSDIQHYKTGVFWFWSTLFWLKGPVCNIWGDLLAWNGVGTMYFNQTKSLKTKSCYVFIC